jgi:protein-S-isoprenylcysteine O-methyltransferase Ste14
MVEHDKAASSGTEQKQPTGILHRLGDFLFRYRSYTPVPLAVVLVWQAETRFPLLLPGLVLIVGGELLRLSAVRSFGRGVRTRRVGAHQLVTWGLYAHMRNPLYLGNLLLWTGAVLFAGGQYLPWLIGVVLMFFLLQYTLIISVEEMTLLELFGESYAEYRRSVPRLIPSFRRSGKTADAPQNVIERSTRPWRYAFRHERSTLMAITAVIILTLLSTYYKT